MVATEVAPDIKRILNLNVVQDYKRTMAENLQASFPGLDPSELDKAIEWVSMSKFVNKPAQLDNNYTKKTINGTVLDILTYIQNLEPIITSSGVLFKKHKEADNPLCKMIMGFLDQRAFFKKEMFKYPKGSAEFEKYNLLQLLEKLNAKCYLASHLVTGDINSV